MKMSWKPDRSNRSYQPVKPDNGPSPADSRYPALQSSVEACRASAVSVKRTGRIAGVTIAAVFAIGGAVFGATAGDASGSNVVAMTLFGFVAGLFWGSVIATVVCGVCMAIGWLWLVEADKMQIKIDVANGLSGIAGGGRPRS